MTPFRAYLPVLLTAALFSLAQPASGIAETLEPSIFFDQDLLAKNRDKFTLSPDGKLISGPVRRAGDAIDYSEVVRLDVLEDAFVFSVNACREGVRHCEASPFKFRERTIQLKILVEPPSPDPDSVSEMAVVLRNTLHTGGFKLEEAVNPRDANIVIFMGEIDYLKKASDWTGDKYVDDFWHRYESAMASTRPIDQLDVYDRLQRESCYVSTVDRKDKQTVYIFLRKQDVNVCLPRSIFAALGLNETATVVASVTDIHGGYKAATYADRVFLNTLYSDDFPLDGGEEEI